MNTAAFTLAWHRMLPWDRIRGLFNGFGYVVMLTVVLKPADANGFAFLDQQRPGAVAVEYVYIPAVHRVRELTPLAGYEPFFGTDFTYQDLSFVPFGGQKRSSRAPRLTMARRPINWRRRWTTTRTTQRL